MAQVINTNTMSLNAQRNLSTSGTNLATTIQRLSSGLRINSAKDDAAGLSISERFSTQIRGANQAARNANDGISLAQTAEGALGEISNNLQRVRELAVQSRNATNSPSDRQALNAEVQLLKQEIQRVAEQTNFNGTNLLDGSFTSKAFQIGADQGQTINISQIANANISKLGNWTSATTNATASGALPAGGAVAAVPGTPGTPAVPAAPATATTSAASGAFATVTLGAGEEFSINVDGNPLFTLTDADGPVDADAIDTALTTGAGAAALAAAGMSTSGSAATNDLVFNKADGTSFTLSQTNDSGAGGFGAGFAATANNGTAASGGTPAVPGTPGTPGTAASFTETSFTITGKGGNAINISVGAADNAGNRATDLANAINAKTHETGVSAALVEGKLELTSKEGNFSIGAGAGSDAAGLLSQTGLTAATTTGYATGDAKVGFADLDVSNIAGADDAILAMDAALNSINSSRADLGAIQNRFTSVVANLNTSSENMSAARSRIRDVDYASETAELSRNQILQQAGTAMLAQANQSSQNVLSLLR